jgi:hypothetical protein
MTTTMDDRWTCRAKQSKRDTRGVGPKPEEYIWLTIEPEFGYASWTSKEPEHGYFKSADEAIEAARNNNGMPWYYQPDMRTLKPVRITIETTVSKTIS